MDETIEASKESENALSGHVQFSGEERVVDETQQNLPDSEEERGHYQEPNTPCEMDKEGIQAEREVFLSAPSITQRKESPVRDICEGHDENREVPIHVKALEGLLQEGISHTTSITNGLNKNGDDADIINMKELLELGPEMINNNSKDSSKLSTTDTQDEIDLPDNGGEVIIFNMDNDTEDRESPEQAKNWCAQSEDSLEEMPGSDLDPHTGETFSTISDSECGDPSKGCANDKSNDIVIINDDQGKQNGSTTPKVHEIKSDEEDNDDCVLTADSACVDIADDQNDDCQVTGDVDCVVTAGECVVTVDTNRTSAKTSAAITPLRRSSRTIKRKKYSYNIDDIDDDSDVEEVTENSVRRKPRPIMINDTKSLVEIAAKQAARSTSAQRREPQLVLIGANPPVKTPISISSSKSCSSSMNESLYQSIVARGTSVTPVHTKATTASQTCQTPPPPPPLILPSLTDDMFVVEAPSFIVPYVYEKPSIEPFKEFVTALGKELEEKKADAVKELLLKKKKEKEKRHQERQEMILQGETEGECDDEAMREAEDNKKKKLEKKEKRRRQKEEDDESWDGSESTDSEDFELTDPDGNTIVINDSIEEAKNDLDMLPASASDRKSDNYFDCYLGKFFMDIGMNLVQEYVQTDLLKQQQRKLQREKKTGHSTKEREVSICLLKKNLELSKENNKHYACPQMKCEHCSFKTESALVLAQHLETPHMKNNLYKCNFCSFEIRSPHDILLHMEAEHNIRGKLERAPAYHQCANCPFEDNGKGKLARHLIACAKKYKPDHNLCPPLEWEPPAKIPKVAKSRSSLTGSAYSSTIGPGGRQQFNNSMVRAPGAVGGGFRPRGRLVPPPVPAPRPVQAGGSIVRGNSMLRHNATLANYPVINAKKSANQPSISITPLPRQPAPPTLHVQAGQYTKSGNFVICEICDGYIKDLDQLRNHMQWIHKVKIHPKMIYNRPPLNCQKCQFRFFTDQGLERHLLGSHGLVTSSMQEAANKSKDAGRCPVCGKVYQWKLLNHVARDHNLTLKPAHLSYKCTVCTATFGMYKLFENHVYSAHSVVAKRVMDKNAPKTNNKTTNAPKGLKINDEITITAQPVKATTANKH